MEKPLCQLAESVPDYIPCLETFSGLRDHIVVVNNGDKEIDPAILQKIADEQNVSISELMVLTKERYEQIMQYAMIGSCPIPNLNALDELSVRASMKVSEISLLPSERDDNRPWYNRFNKKRKGRR